MKYLIFCILILSFITSCSKFPDPSYEIVSGYNFIKNGSNQRTLAGEFLKDSISIKINGQGSVTAGMRVEFTMLKGGGELTNPVSTIDGSGLAYTRWKLGITGNQQIVKATIYDSKGMFISSANFTAYAFRPNVWDTVSGQPDASMWDLAADTVNKLTFMTSCGQLYRQTDRYYNWEFVNVNNTNGITSVKIDSKSFVYVCNSVGDVFISKDRGNSWNQCTKPFPGNSNYPYLFVSNNDYAWVSTTDKKLAYSKDGGNIWHDASAGLEDGDGLGEIYRHPDGTLFFRTTNYRLFKSEDDGSSWTRVTSQDRADELFITADGDILLYAAYMKHRILKSTDKGEHFTEIYSISSNSWTSKLNFFNYYKGTYYILVPGQGILRTKDLIHFEEYWNKDNLLNLFLDHNGILMASDLSSCLFYRNNL